MRLFTFQHHRSKRAGAERKGGVVDLSARMDGISIGELIASGRLEEAAQIAATSNTDFLFNDIIVDLPIYDPPMIYCVGVNYMNRNEEYRDGSKAPQYPSLFVRSPASFAAHGDTILLPPESEQLDYEGEIVLVIGKQGRRIAQKNAMDHVAGLTIMNEGSIRDWIRHGKFNVTPGKNWYRSGGLGPWIETDISNLNMTDLHIETKVNGELRQADTTASLAFPFTRIIEYISTFAPLRPGDLIATGTPSGSGGRYDPPRWLKPGDTIEVTVEGVGTLSNTVEKEVIE